MKTVDLHMHSVYSDGSMTPTELVLHAKERGIAAIALTDHDSVGGVSEAIKAGKEYGIEVVSGIEFSVWSATETHILGYYIDIEHPLLKEAMESVMEARDTRMRNTEKLLKKIGFVVTYEEALALAPNGMVGRAHFARVMMDKGYVSSVKEGFDKYLANGKPAFDGTQSMTARGAVELITKIGGVSFVAHPHLIRLDDIRLTEFLTELKKYGLDGIEGYYNEYTPDMQSYFISKAGQLGLGISGGTDYHARMKPHIEMGIGQGNMSIPYSVLEGIKNIRRKKFNI